MTKMAELEVINENFEDIKGLINGVKDSMITNEECNNQFFNVIQALENISTSLNDLMNEESKPSDEYTILQTNILEVKKELSKMNTSIDETINVNLKELLSKLTEKVNRLEILTNNAGIDQQVIKNITGQLEKSLSEEIRGVSDSMKVQGSSSSGFVKEEISVLRDNLKDCVEYLENSNKTVSSQAVRSISDDLTMLGQTIEKNNDNLKRSVIDIFTRIQEEVTKKSSHDNQEFVSNGSDSDYEMLKTGIYNLNINTEEHISALRNLIFELDIFKKLESFSKLKDLPAIGDLKHTLQSSINRVVDQYSYTLQSSQNRDELDEATRQFRKDIFDEIVSMLGNVSEYLVENEDALKAKYENENSQLNQFAEKIDELTSVTELNNSGYDNILIDLKDLREKCSEIKERLESDSKKSLAKKSSLEESMSEIKNNVEEMLARSESIKKQGSEVSEVVRECANSIIEHSEPDRKNIKEMLSDIKKNISILQSGDEESDYTYSMQDIESDIAKIRIYLNELSQNGVSVNSEEFSDELNSVVVMVDSMKQQLNKIDECDLSDTMAKMQEDVTSVSTRVNKLLLTSDSSYELIDKALKEFKLLSQEIDEQIKSMADANKFKSLENSLKSIKTSLEESNSYNSIINQSLVLLAEWVDSAGEALTNISDKQSKLDAIDELKSLVSSGTSDVVSSVKDMLEETNLLVKGIEAPIDYSDTFKELENRLAEQSVMLDKQEERLNKLDEKLTTVLELSAKNDFAGLASKLNDIDDKMERLNKSIERLTAYVNED